MDSLHISASDLAPSLSDVLNRVKYRGERFLIERAGEPIAELVSPARPRGRTAPEFVELIGDLAVPAGGFGADLARLRTAQGEARDPWHS